MLDEKDLFVRYATFTALNRLGRAHPSYWLQIVTGLESENRAIREGILFAIRETYDPKLVEALTKVARSPETIAALAEMHRHPAPWKGDWWGTQPVARPRPAKAVEYAGTKLVLETLRAALGDANAAVRRAAVDSVAVTKDAPGRRGPARPVREGDGRRGPEVDPEVARRDQGLRRGGARGVGVQGSRAADRGGRRGRADRRTEADPDARGARRRGDGARNPGPRARRAGPAQGGGAHGREARGPRRSQGRARRRHGAGQIGGDAAVQALTAATEDSRLDVRKAAIAALGTLAAKPAVAALLRRTSTSPPASRRSRRSRRSPDLRALDAYLEGLGGKNATVRDQCRKAVAALGSAALPAIEAKMEATLLSNDVVLELQRLYNKPVAVTEWMILGSFPNPCPEPFPADAPAMAGSSRIPRAVPSMEEGEGLERAGDGEPAEPDDRPDDATAYAAAELESPAERTVEFVGGSDDTMTVWLNGKKIFEDLGNHGWKWDAYHFRGTLKAGEERGPGEVRERRRRLGVLARVSRAAVGAACSRRSRRSSTRRRTPSSRRSRRATRRAGGRCSPTRRASPASSATRWAARAATWGRT